MPSVTILSLLDIATIVCIGLLVGSEVCLTVFTNPVVTKLDEPAQANAAYLLTARLATPMPLWNVLGLLPLVSEAVVRHNETGFYFLVAACILWIAAAAFTFIFMFPLNTRLARTDPNSSPKESHSTSSVWLHVTVLAQ
jgi:uncharacterized membrane protein